GWRRDHGPLTPRVDEAQPRVAVLEADRVAPRAGRRGRYRVRHRPVRHRGQSRRARPSARAHAPARRGDLRARRPLPPLVAGCWGEALMGLLEGKVAVVSGAARGQGRSHAVRLAREGADVIAMDICADIDTVHYPLARPEDLDETVAQIERLGRRVIASQTDVRDATAVMAAIDHAVAKFGRLDTVVANAGIAM